MTVEKGEKEKPEPDISGKGKDFLDTIQVLQNKEIHEGYLEAELHFRFGSAFCYPLIFKIQGMSAVPETIALAFDISQTDKTKQLVEEKLIVPRVCRNMTRDQVVEYLADIVETNSFFAFYLHKQPRTYEKLKFYPMIENQKIVFNEHLVMAIIKILDRRKRIRQTNT